MAFPSSTASPPALETYQAWFNGSVWGRDANGINLKEIDGLDLSTAFRTGDAGRPRDHGEFAGIDLLPGRDITLKLDVAAGGGLTFAEAMTTLAGCMIPQGSTETPFYVCVPQGTFAVMARPRQKSAPVNKSWEAGSGIAENVQCLVHATDPRFYSCPTQLTTIALEPVTGIGLSLDPLSLDPLSFGGPSDPSSAVLVNAGNIDCRPVLTINGPCINPSITNGSLSGNPTIAFDITLHSGYSLVVSTDNPRTALLYNPNSSIGSPALSTLASGSTWWSLQPGANLIQFNASTSLGQPSLVVEWASAYLL